MKRKMLFAAACAAALWSAAAMALPTASDVQSAVNAGDYGKAETLVKEVVAAKPQNARAHYFYAEILAHEEKFGEASAQARQARELDPALSFTKDPEKFRSFERELQRTQAPPAATPHNPSPDRVNMAPANAQPTSGGGIPGWVWIGGLAVVGFLIFRAVSRRAVANNMAAGGYATPGGYGVQPGMQQPGYGPGYGQGYGQAPGGGLLRTGMAVAGGVAGGMLLEKMLDGNHHDQGNGYGSQGVPYDGGSGQAASDLENRPFDAGQGSNDWSDGGSDNFTPSGGGDDGGW
jgi:hypothetical protein